MLSIEGIGLLTTLLGLVATSIGAGVVVAGFAAASAGMFARRSRREVEGSALRNSFWGGLLGICCLCYDLLAG